MKIIKLTTLPFFFLGWLAITPCHGIDFSFLKENEGYTINLVEIEHDFEKLKLTVINGDKSVPIVLNGSIKEKDIHFELVILYANSRPISYNYKKWKDITHPDLSAEKGEISQVLLEVQSGLFEKLQNEIKDARLKKVFASAVKEVEKLTRKNRRE